MALQGTLETFGLAEVLRMLASSAKTGLLTIEGDRGTGQVWLCNGELVAATCQGTPDGTVAEVIFDLLRFVDGSFHFDNNIAVDDLGHGLDVESTVTLAQELLADWLEVCSIVPSVQCVVRIASEPPSAEVTLAATDWRVLAQLGAGSAVSEIGRRLGLTDVEAARMVGDLVTRKLVVVGESLAPDDRSPGSASACDDVDSTLEDLFPDGDDLGALRADVADESWSPDRLTGEHLDTAFAGSASEMLTVDPVLDGLGSDGDESFGLDAGLGGSVAEEDLPASDGALDGLSHLSPKAAAAIEAMERSSVGAGPDDFGDDSAPQSLVDALGSFDDLPVFDPAETLDADVDGPVIDGPVIDGDPVVSAAVRVGDDEGINRNQLMNFLRTTD